MYMPPKTPYAPKVGTVVNLNRVLAAKQGKAQASLSVAIRVRPILQTEVAKNGRKDILRVLDGKVVLVLDPDETKDYLDQVQNRTKEKKYVFDIAYGTQSTNVDVYEGSIRDLTAGITNGLNGTVFAYGSTGSGKTHTMVGTPSDPGLMVLSLAQIFCAKEMVNPKVEDFSVTCSYLEVYNEVIYDLLVKNSAPLELREDPDQGVCVAGLKRIMVTSSQQIMSLLQEGNHRRKTDSTDANATSSRSHAVLEICVTRTPCNGTKGQVLAGKLSLVDLAGSERAAETNNIGQKLRDGANINRSLLALANCINALGKQQRSGVVYVPFRNSKLTRLLKDGLSGNSRTTMVATVAAASDQYHHSVNTLKYADRAKEIKTHVVQNLAPVERHITDYKNIIDNLQGEVEQLRAALADKSPLMHRSRTESLSDPSDNPTTSASGAPAAAHPSTGAMAREADTLAWIDALAQQINENIEERINLQKALFELEDINVCNQYELQNIEEMIKTGSATPSEVAEAMERRQLLTEELQENEAATERYRADIAANEAARKEIQAKIDKSAIDTNNNANFLKILSTFRIQAVRLQELKFQMAVRDQIISEQKDVIGNLWKILEASGLSRQNVMEIARQEGILMQGFVNEGDESAAEAAPLQPEASSGKAAGRRLGKEAVGVKQNLLGGKARYRYKFWQQYQAGDAPTANSRVLYDMAGARSSGGALSPASPGGSPQARGHRHPHLAGGGRRPSPLNRNISGGSPFRNGSDLVRNSSPQHQRRVGDKEQAGLHGFKDSTPSLPSTSTSAATAAAAAAAATATTTGRQHRSPTRSTSDLSPTRIHAATHPASSSHTQHHHAVHPPQPHNSSSTALKRFTLPAVTHEGTSHHTSHSKGLTHSLESSVEVSGASNPYLAAIGPNKAPRRRQKAATSSDGAAALHPGLPGGQHNANLALAALQAHRKRATVATPVAWEEHQQQAAEEKQSPQQKKAGQLAAVYKAAPSSSNQLLAKLGALKRRSASNSNSASVSAEPSSSSVAGATHPTPSRSHNSQAASHHTSSSHGSSSHGSSGVHASHSSFIQGTKGSGAAGAAGRLEPAPSAPAGLPSIAEKAALSELRRRQQLQRLAQQRDSAH